jgi:hypothetical protein
MYETKTVSQLISDQAVEKVGRRQLLEAELFHRGIQLQNFHRHRERLVSKQIDPQSTYNRIQELYDHNKTELRKFADNRGAPAKDKITGDAIPYEARLVHEELMPAKFAPDTSSIPFGYAGYVQMPRAEEGISVTPSDQSMSGELITIERRPLGGILFNGLIEDTRDGIPVDEYDPTVTYVWLRNWKYLVPFPPPTYRARFTYQFEVIARASLFNESDPATFMSFVSVGEEADYTVGSDITVDTDAGWPLVADLTVSNLETGWYSGRYGYLAGRSTLQRSFMVDAGDTPAIAIVVGAIGIISRLGNTTYFFGGTGYSSITPQDESGIEGRIAFHYVPELVLAP